MYYDGQEGPEACVRLFISTAAATRNDFSDALNDPVYYYHNTQMQFTNSKVKRQSDRCMWIWHGELIRSDRESKLGTELRLYD